jgi:crotonobetainyl-CoA:carnitine CoA-transferase CaiB-like acyl-CoA transferase
VTTTPDATDATDASTADPPAAGLRVVEIGESIAAATVGMVLADHGAEVVVVEPPRGSRLRALPAFPMLARGKHSTCLDLTTPAGRDALAELVTGADVVIAALTPATMDRLGVDGATLCAGNPRLVHCEITGFDRGHPLADVAGHEGVVAARAGRAYEFSVLFNGRRPAFPAVPVATWGAAMLALQGIGAALVERARTGRGQRVATSLLRALTVYDLSGWAPGSVRALRLGDAGMLFYTVARTRDGVWIQFSQNSPALFHALLRALDLVHLLEDARFRTAPHLTNPDDTSALRALLLDRVAERSWDEWQAVFDQDPDLSAEPLTWPGDALTHPQLVHTGDVREVEVVGLGTTRQLGPLATFTATPARPPGPPPAPPPGPPHGAGVAAPHAWHTLQPSVSAAPPAPGRDARAGDRAAGEARLLEGVTILELATWIATPMATALLAELGARVVKIEPLDGDPMRHHGPAGLKCVQGKESLAVDLKTSAGREIVERLAARADGLLHNFRPGVPERLGIDHATLSRLNPRLIHLYAGSYGSSGPMAHRAAFHVTAGAVCGGALLQAGADGAPGPDVVLTEAERAWWSQRLVRCNESNPDFNAAVAVAAAFTLALVARDRTGTGQAVETRMMASNAYTLVEHFIGYPARPPRPVPDAGLHGLDALYRLYGTADGWVFVAARNGVDFARLCDVVGRPELADDPRFADAAARAHHDDELAELLAQAFTARSAGEWERALVAAGVAGVAAHDGPHAAYVFDAPSSRELGLVEDSTSSGYGPYPRYGRAVRTGHDLGPPGAADATGAQTRAILAELGYDDAAVAELVASGVVGVPVDPLLASGTGPTRGT